MAERMYDEHCPFCVAHVFHSDPEHLYALRVEQQKSKAAEDKKSGKKKAKLEYKQAALKRFALRERSPNNELSKMSQPDDKDLE